MSLSRTVAGLRIKELWLLTCRCCSGLQLINIKCVSFEIKIILFLFSPVKDGGGYRPVELDSLYMYSAPQRSWLWSTSLMFIECLLSQKIIRSSSIIKTGCYIMSISSNTQACNCLCIIKLRCSTLMVATNLPLHLDCTVIAKVKVNNSIYYKPSIIK